MKNKIKSILFNKEFRYTRDILCVVSGIILGAILIHNPKSFDTMDILMVGVLVLMESVIQLFRVIKENKPPEKIHHKDIEDIDLRDFQ